MFFSNQTTLGSLKSFKFFNSNQNATIYIAEKFRTLIIEKTNTWFNTTNLIYYDALSIFDRLKEFYSGKGNVSDVEQYQIKNLAVKNIDYFDPLNRINFTLNELELNTFKIIFAFNWRKKEDTDFKSGAFTVFFNVPFTISHRNYTDISNIGYIEDFCNEFDHLSLCKGIVATFFETFHQIYCDYFSSIRSEICIGR